MKDDQQVVSDPAPATSHELAASYLHQLLLRPGSYRRRWERHVVRERRGEINQLAVAEVLAEHLWSYPRRDGDAELMPRQLKDSVSRALSGRLLSRPTLTLFIDAFGISAAEADRLWRLWNGSASIMVLSGRGVVSPQAEDEVRAALGPRRHQTLSMHDHAEVSADGRLARTRTMQVIEAVAPDVDRIPFLYDTSMLTLELGTGCRRASGRLYQIGGGELGGGVFATEILLAKVLGVGETATLEYGVTYQYTGDPHDRQQREYRRAVMSGMENFDMRVQFHPRRLPAQVWWASWDGLDGPVTLREEASLDMQYAAHRYLRSVERSVVGFYWSW